MKKRKYGEYRILLTEEEYDGVRGWAELHYFTLLGSSMRANYYYDTDGGFFRNGGTTLCIRQENGVLQSNHKGFSGGMLPGSLQYKGKTAVLWGMFVTERLTVSLRPGIRLYLDRNTYLGRTDYELKLTFARSTRNHAARFAEELFRTVLPKPYCGKAERFWAALDEMRKESA